VKVANLKTLSAQQWRWVWVSWWSIWWIQCKLRWDRTDWLMQRLEETSVSQEDQAQRRLAEQMHESVRIAARLHPWRAECLPKSLALMRLLERVPLNARLCLGVRKQKAGSEPQLSSHAWVELGGGPICEPESVQREFRLVRTGLPLSSQ
jgi:hypothetical protein